MAMKLEYGVPTDREGLQIRLGIKTTVMHRAIERESASLNFDCEIDLEGPQAAIALQQKLGAIKRPLAPGDVSDSRFQPRH